MHVLHTSIFFRGLLFCQILLLYLGFLPLFMDADRFIAAVIAVLSTPVLIFAEIVRLHPSGGPRSDEGLTVRMT